MVEFFKNITSDDFIFAAYFMLILTAGTATIVYSKHIFRLLRLHLWRAFLMRGFLTAFFILGIAAFTTNIRAYFQAWKSGQYIGIDTNWMLSHPYVGVIIIMFSLIYVGHTGTITYDKYGHRFWIITLIVSVIGFFIGLWFTQYNEWAKELVSWAM